MFIPSYLVHALMMIISLATKRARHSHVQSALTPSIPPSGGAANSPDLDYPVIGVIAISVAAKADC